MTHSVPIREVATCTCLRLRKASRRLTQFYDTCLEPSGLTITQFGLLAHLHAMDGVTIGNLAEAMVMDPTTVTRNLRPLEKRDLVKIDIDSGDRRRRIVQLTALGIEALTAAIPLWRTAQKGAADALGVDEAKQLNQILDFSLERLTTL